MLLSYKKILELVKEKAIIENFSLECLSSSGYDLRIGKIYKIKTPGFIGCKKHKSPKIEELEFNDYKLKPNEYLLIETIEKVNIPENLAARILPRSSLFRMGCSLETALVDPGFKGTLTIGLKNLTEREFKFEKGARIAQIVFEEVSEGVKLYKGRYQGGKVI